VLQKAIFIGVVLLLLCKTKQVQAAIIVLWRLGQGWDCSETSLH